MDKKKHIAVMVGVIIILAGGMFYAGMKYGVAKNSAARSAQRGEAGSNFGGGRGQRAAGSGMTGGGANGDFVSGEILAKDDKSITVKTRDGGSKIVYFSDATTVGKAVSGAVSDLVQGDAVMINGKANSDGSLTAQNVQIRPADDQRPGNDQPQQ